MGESRRGESILSPGLVNGIGLGSGGGVGGPNSKVSNGQRKRTRANFRAAVVEPVGVCIRGKQRMKATYANEEKECKEPACNAVPAGSGQTRKE